jgi:hypothetical protein
LFQFLFKEELQKKDKLQKIGILQKKLGQSFSTRFIVNNFVTKERASLIKLANVVTQ